MNGNCRFVEGLRIPEKLTDFGKPEHGVKIVWCRNVMITLNILEKCQILFITGLSMLGNFPGVMIEVQGSYGQLPSDVKGS